MEFAYLGRSDTQIKLRGNRIEPGEIEAAAAAHPDVAQAVADLRHTPHGPRLALYVVPVQGHSVDTTAVREHLIATLPAVMVPDSLTVLAALPLAPTGKIDRAALPEPVVQPSTVFRAPSTDTERVLAAIVGDLLGRDRVGVDDSFFALGGDSIGSIQLVSRAKAHGMLLAPRQVFEHQTVAALARVAKPITEQETLPELPGGGVGSMPLTPVMRLVLGRGHYEHFAQATALQLPAGIDRAGILATLTVVIDHHDALRASLTDTGLDIAAPGSVDLDAALHHVRVDPARPARELRSVNSTRHGPTPTRAPGVMMQFVWLDPTDGARGRLLVVAHHLVVDAVSWRILVPDLVATWAQLDRRRAGDPGPGRHLDAALGACPHRRRPQRRTRPLANHTRRPRSTPREPRPRPHRGHHGHLGPSHRGLPVETTTRLLTVPAAAFRADAVDALLAALTLAVRRWRRARGIDESSVLVQFEGHGREETLAPGADLTRTVGWFTTVYPARFDLTGIDDHDTDTALKTVKEQRRAIPDNGIGYGLLRELTRHPEVLAG